MDRHIQLLISEDFAERILPENDSIGLLDEIIDDLDLSCIYGTYSRPGRKCATSIRVIETNHFWEPRQCARMRSKYRRCTYLRIYRVYPVHEAVSARCQAMLCHVPKLTGFPP